jgi:hypothetical protein
MDQERPISDNVSIDDDNQA